MTLHTPESRLESKLPSSFFSFFPVVPELEVSWPDSTIITEGEVGRRAIAAPSTLNSLRRLISTTYSTSVVPGGIGVHSQQHYHTIKYIYTIPHFLLHLIVVILKCSSAECSRSRVQYYTIIVQYISALTFSSRQVQFPQ